jgi:hypothetical protein
MIRQKRPENKTGRGSDPAAGLFDIPAALRRRIGS